VVGADAVVTAAISAMVAPAAKVAKAVAATMRMVETVERVDGAATALALGEEERGGMVEKVVIP